MTPCAVLQNMTVRLYLIVLLLAGDSDSGPSISHREVPLPHDASDTHGVSDSVQYIMRHQEEEEQLDHWIM